ncbi:hypothetical protein CENSYa_1153 [Cenarchaeum symbiosum A]|uniref:Uncharacterized protein n=1 Tax=Cenarchaeum symbiosum (strain A) TaxID=414004 RepID=A0RWR3_CENSY|nr:hypothetical protein CENSYa_1153 [Cenarchaeum symbiosum A]
MRIPPGADFARIMQPNIRRNGLMIDKGRIAGRRDFWHRGTGARVCVQGKISKAGLASETRFCGAGGKLSRPGG